MTNIIIAGDYVAQNRVARLLKNGQFEKVFGGIKELIAGSDYSIVNLEAPIAADGSCKIKKEGPNLNVSSDIILALQYLGFNAVTLANNHLRDYGDESVINTIKLLENNNVTTIGAGENITEASKTRLININGAKVAIINCCEHEFSIATEDHAGANPLDVIAQYYAIQKAKEFADYTLVIVHGGIEMYELPTPRMKKIYRFFIDAGADAVINHHQHCFSGYEIYNEKPIFYGLGNFCFDWEKRQNFKWVKGYLVKINFDKKISFSLIPYDQCSNQPSVRLLNSQENEYFINKIDQLNDIISSNQRLQTEYTKYLDKTRYTYKAVLSPYSNRILQSLYIRNLIPGFISKKKLYSIKNKIECESHRERLLDMIYKELK